MRYGWALLGVLLVVGLLAAGVGTALGIGEAFQGEAGVIKVTVDDGNVIITQRGGNKLVKVEEITLMNYTKLSEEVEEKVVEIALSNETIRGLVGENYQVKVSQRIEFQTKYIDGKLTIIVAAKKIFMMWTLKKYGTRETERR
jgi:hypothetical protein